MFRQKKTRSKKQRKMICLFLFLSLLCFAVANPPTPSLHAHCSACLRNNFFISLFTVVCWHGMDSTSEDPQQCAMIGAWVASKSKNIFFHNLVITGVFDTVLCWIAESFHRSQTWNSHFLFARNSLPAFWALLTTTWLKRVRNCKPSPSCKTVCHCFFFSMNRWRALCKTGFNAIGFDQGGLLYVDFTRRVVCRRAPCNRAHVARTFFLMFFRAACVLCNNAVPSCQSKIWSRWVLLVSVLKRPIPKIEPTKKICSRSWHFCCSQVCSRWSCLRRCRCGAISGRILVVCSVGRFVGTCAKKVLPLGRVAVLFAQFFHDPKNEARFDCALALWAVFSLSCSCQLQK